MRRNQLVLLPPNRVWRSYLGGATLDRLAGVPAPCDSHFPEDWVASVTEARHPGRDAGREGVSQVRVGDESFDFRALLASDPEYFLGPEHVARYGASPMLLVKMLDSAIRLHFQCHPTRDFARRVLGSPSGKTEAYHILDVRPEVPDPHIYAGFRDPPTREQLRSWIEAQDIAALENCFQRVSVRRGETYLIPGGCPHALGPGVFMVEIQEPTDWVVRLEFERGGYVLPEAARFMGRDVEFALDMIELTGRTRGDVDRDFRCVPTRRRSLAAGAWQDEVIGPSRTPCFQILKTHLRGAVTRNESGFHIGIVTAGAVTVSVGGTTWVLHACDKYFLPAGIGPVAFTPAPAAEILECHPPA